MSTVIALIVSHLLAGGIGAFVWNKYKAAAAAKLAAVEKKL